MEPMREDRTLVILMPLSTSGHFKKMLQENSRVANNQCMYLLASEMEPEQLMLGNIHSEEPLIKQIQGEDNHPWSKALIVSPMMKSLMKE